MSHSNPNIKHIKQKIDVNNKDILSKINRYDNIFLKMDIEGGEYDLLSCLDQSLIKKFKQIVIEFHDCYNTVRINLVKKLFVDHKLIHFHANNCCGTTNIFGIQMPRIFELTLIRNNCLPSDTEIIQNKSGLPTDIDYPNIKSRPDIKLDYYPFKVI